MRQLAACPRRAAAGFELSSSRALYLDEERRRRFFLFFLQHDQGNLPAARRDRLRRVGRERLRRGARRRRRRRDGFLCCGPWRRGPPRPASLRCARPPGGAPAPRCSTTLPQASSRALLPAATTLQRRGPRRRPKGWASEARALASLAPRASPPRLRGGSGPRCGGLLARGTGTGPGPSPGPSRRPAPRRC